MEVRWKLAPNFPENKICVDRFSENSERIEGYDWNQNCRAKGGKAP